MPGFKYWERETLELVYIVFLAGAPLPLQRCWDLCVHLSSAVTVSGCQAKHSKSCLPEHIQPGAAGGWGGDNQGPTARSNASLGRGWGLAAARVWHSGWVLFSAAWISQPGISGMRKPWVFDGLPAINSKLTPMKVVLWYFYCLKFKSLLWPQSLNFPLTRATHGASEAPLTSVGGWMQRILHWPKEQYKSVFTAAYCSQLVSLYT